MKRVVTTSMLLPASSVMAISDTEKEAVIEQMKEYGWNMVKACTDQDIEAERALSQC